MAVVFKGEVELMLNRHGSLGDGISITFKDPEFYIFANTGGKYTLQIGAPAEYLNTEFETITDAYIAAQVRFGKVELKDGMYVPVNA